MNNRTPFFDYNGTHVAVVGKSGSSAIARAIHYALQPDYKVISASGDESMVQKVMHNPGWQAMVPKTFDPVNPLIPVRDPVERFRSACAQDGRTADDALDRIDAGELSFHFKPVQDYLRGRMVTLFKFPEHIEKLAQAIGLTEISEVNTSETNNGPKPDLTPEQLTRVQAIYADDIALYNSINEAGQELVIPEPEPEPEPVPQKVTPYQFRSALIDRSVPLASIETALSQIEDDTTKQKALAAWEYALEVRRDHPLVGAIAQALGYDANDVDDLFREADRIRD